MVEGEHVSGIWRTPVLSVEPQVPVWIWRVSFLLLGSQEPIAGCLICDEAIRTYVIVKDVDQQLPPIQYLRVLLGESPMIVGNILERAYMNRRHLEIDGELVLWCDYQEVLSDCRFHEPLPQPSQILSIFEDNADGEDEQEDRDDANP